MLPSTSQILLGKGALQQQQPDYTPNTPRPASNGSSSKPQQQFSAAATVVNDPSAAAAEEDVYPTFVPRNPGVTDGQWNNTDAAIVKMAVADAEKAVVTKKTDETGVHSCQERDLSCC
jgi:hypothetical protein